MLQYVLENTSLAIDATTTGSQTLLHIAAAAGDTTVACSCLYFSACLTAADKQLRTPLHLASINVRPVAVMPLAFAPLACCSAACLLVPHRLRSTALLGLTALCGVCLVDHTTPALFQVRPCW